MKEIILFSYGDANNASSWSNVPYCFSKELERRGIIVRKTNIAPSKWLSKAFSIVICKLLKMRYPLIEYDWTRTSLFAKLTEYKIKRTVEKYSSAECCIFMNFDFCNRYLQIPSILFCDWTYQILIKDRQKRNLYPLEEKFALRQSEAIMRAKLVISLFPCCAKKMEIDYPNANIHCLGGNIINNLCRTPLNLETVINKKLDSNKILFIGQKKYLIGAKLVIQAMEEIRGKGLNYTLDIIGLKVRDIGNIPDFVTCHGYLHKDNYLENELYYRLICDAKVLINPCKIWGGFSSTIEAMYFATPVIVAPYEDFVTTFGKEVKFGYYFNSSSPECLANLIEKLEDKGKYKSMCVEAHAVTSNHTWENYVDKMIELWKKQ